MGTIKFRAVASIVVDIEVLPLEGYTDEQWMELYRQRFTEQPELMLDYENPTIGVTVQKQEIS